MLPLIVFVYGFVVVLSLKFLGRACARKMFATRPPLPPGPPSDPIIGHLRIIPSQHQPNAFHDWSKTYGDVMQLRVPGRSIIILSSDKAATDLLEKRGLNYSSRPNFIIMDIMGWGQSLAFLPYGKRFLRHRKIVSQPLGREEIKLYQPIQIQAVQVLLKALLARPTCYEEAVHRFTTSTIVEMAFGHRITSDDDIYLTLAREHTYSVDNSGPPGNTPVDFLPCLRYFPSWFPGTYFAEWARTWSRVPHAIREIPYGTLIRDIEQGHNNPSILGQEIQKMLDTGSKTEARISDIKDAAAIIFGAGVDSTEATLSIFFLLMMRHPECQKKAQAEIDSVLGGGRLPNHDDRPHLPYVEALFQEIKRWFPVVPLGLPHLCMNDDIYRGMFIPKGSIVFANARAISLDESVYHDPARFYPERFLPKPEGRGEPHFTAAFGYGRRICPGRLVADATLWLASASILSMFNVEVLPDKNGRYVVPTPEFCEGLAHHPNPFDCNVVVRSGHAETIISQAC
ncbi:cytochrome P450 [Guyanagaster necrorhizus]|uniref:Cytochrome P450 n=1 Tax=Guyanagaster necrorhizus TaxID=856835 RepID=A0A9P7VU28_9AGAR|nr:cytochrome P450 [Guyanagaster necrorhizus MCA 3950]KAG7446882.1 cytochrome P450 [Guyanagaster necrorhizus MCA 3950]